jgi:hypothetical protein
MDVSGRILRAWMPAIHADMTKTPFSFSVGERKLMKRFVVAELIYINSRINERATSWEIPSGRRASGPPSSRIGSS